MQNSALSIVYTIVQSTIASTSNISTVSVNCGGKSTGNRGGTNTVYHSSINAAYSSRTSAP
jgi:hypothetical protein